MEILGIQQTFSNGVKLKVLKADNGALVLSISGGPLVPILQASQLESLDVPTDKNDILRLQSLLRIAVAVADVTG